MGKPRRQQSDNLDDDITDGKTELTLSNSANGIQDSVPVSKKEKRKAKKKRQMDNSEDEEEDEMPEDLGKDCIDVKPKKRLIASFQMLAIFDDSNEEVSTSDEDERERKEIVLESVNMVPKQASKKEKKRKKQKNAEEEEIDALLAEIEKPTEKLQKKGKKERKRQKEELEQTPADEDATSSIEQQESRPVIMLEPKIITMEDLDEDDEKHKKKKVKKEKRTEEKEVKKDAIEEDEADVGFTVKTAAQKRKEKKEREKQKKLLEKKKVTKTVAAAEVKLVEEKEKVVADMAEEKPVEKKKKKGEKEEKAKKKKPQLSKIKEALEKIREEEKRLCKEEEEKFRREEESRQRREEQKRLDEERKQKRRQKEKERKERLKAEGKLLTEKQKHDRRRAQQMLEAVKLHGVDVSGKDVLRKRPVYGDRRKRKQQSDVSGEMQMEDSLLMDEEEEEEMVVELEPAQEEPKTEEESEDEVKDSWDISSGEEDNGVKTVKPVMMIENMKVAEEEDDDESEEEEEDESEDDDESSEDDDDDSEVEEDEEEEERTGIEKARERIEKRREEADKKRTTENLRAPVVCVLGHVDTGKTKILDKLRRTHVQDAEAGGITQQIGATNVPKDAIREQTKMCKEFQKNDLKLPGLLIIDTPGHESFSNLRSRGSSLCDIAILVVDIMHGLEPQTIESINLLKQRKTPFIIALNKIDRLFQWKTTPSADVSNTIKKQNPNTKIQFDELAKEIIVQFAEQGLNAALFYENKNSREYLNLVPTSAHTGDGMGNLIALICELSQSMLAKRLSYSEELQATVMEVKALPSMGTTIDVILVNGKLRESETIVVAGTEGPIVTQLRGLLTPQPMRELRVKAQYEHHKEIIAAQGVKIMAKDLEKALAGLPLYVAYDHGEVEYYKEEVASALKDVLSGIKLQERGVFVQASTLGSLEALLEFLRTSKIPYAGINIGPVHKKDIMRASIMLEHDSQFAVILAFDVKVERDAQELADSLAVRIFVADIIYHLFDKFMSYREELKKQKREEFKHVAVFPCKVRVLPQFVFNSRDPIVVGVVVEAGFIKEGTPLCVPSKEFVDIGRITSIECNHKTVDMARKGQEVCIKIEPIPGESPKMFGRHFDHTDLLISKISRQSIDAVKDYFREEMQKTDWQLILELKKMFSIL